MDKSLILLLATTGVTGLTSCGTAHQAEKTAKPNIVYIICDDLGYGDVSFLNPQHGKIATPNIDKLASQGMTFTDAHSASSVSTPSRYGVLTGRYAWRTELQHGVLRAGNEFKPLIAKDRMTVPELLKKAGYDTAIMGKWHLGFNIVAKDGSELKKYEGRKVIQAPVGAVVQEGPVTRGFDSFIGFHHAASISTLIQNDTVAAHIDPVKMLPLLQQHACDYIAKEAKDGNPFFLYLPLNSPHTPIVPSKEWEGKSGIGKYGDFVMQTDYVVGQVLKALEDNGIADNTLVFFTSDNGCSFPATHGEMLEKKFGHYPSAQFRGGKSDIWEGGHRVPFIVRWARHIQANVKNKELICLTNLMATCAEITGQHYPETAGEDSYSILPLLKDIQAKSDYHLVIHHSINGKFSIRKGPWKLEMCPGSGGWSGPTDVKARSLDLPTIQLYNMETDESEKVNVYDQHPEIVKQLTAKLKEIVLSGRSTPGHKEKNDVSVDILKENQ